MVRYLDFKGFVILFKKHAAPKGLGIKRICLWLQTGRPYGAKIELNGSLLKTGRPYGARSSKVGSDVTNISHVVKNSQAKLASFFIISYSLQVT